ncbi:DUF6292 family protein [Streptosporangium carneum]|uniref:DUF6292 domain-containing protein n=1 Tax=Streptosporangium carneum TaxID=47481 RepID=A0A9W6I622_9ACTN|nr:DUF6292 family protein [Streptosporangium carneum]GLK11615.1 hypothetical protein GCM10017600_50220 [Streptosporangium carneum]
MGVKHVEPYTEEWRRQPAFYVSRVVQAMGAEVTDWWEGPCDPRAATILLTGGDALVWDEESGWRRGRYVSGDHDRCTVLADSRYLGGGLLPSPDRVPAAVADALAGVGNSTAWRPCYRSYRHYRDGFDLALNGYLAYADV